MTETPGELWGLIWALTQPVVLTVLQFRHMPPKSSVPPPVLYVAALLIGMGLNSVWPMSPAGGRGRIIPGIACIIASAIIMPGVLIRFHRARTTFDPRRVASALVTDGPYRFSRHPSYVALTLLYFGVGLLLSNGWILLLTVPVLLVMNRWIVRREEHQLEMKFGEEYRRYQSNVRRWL